MVTLSTAMMAASTGFGLLAVWFLLKEDPRATPDFLLAILIGVWAIYQKMRGF